MLKNKTTYPKEKKTHSRIWICKIIQVTKLFNNNKNTTNIVVFNPVHLRGPWPRAQETCTEMIRDLQRKKRLCSTGSERNMSGTGTIIYPMKRSPGPKEKSFLSFSLVYYPDRQIQRTPSPLERRSGKLPVLILCIKIFSIRRTNLIYECPEIFWM